MKKMMMKQMVAVMAVEEVKTDYSTASEDILIATINQFPVQVIAMEKCQDTLDGSIVESEEDLRDAEWGSMIIQVIMTLLAYRNV